jgi:CIC family chloride channel protein
LIFIGLGALALYYPQLLGNGKDVVQLTFLNQMTGPLLLALFILKPLVTAGCLASGAPGGLFTPTLTTGALAGALFGTAWNY